MDPLWDNSSREHNPISEACDCDELVLLTCASSELGAIHINSALLLLFFLKRGVPPIYIASNGNT